MLDPVRLVGAGTEPTLPVGLVAIEARTSPGPCLHQPLEQGPPAGGQGRQRSRGRQVEPHVEGAEPYLYAWMAPWIPWMTIWAPITASIKPIILVTTSTTFSPRNLTSLSPQTKKA